MSAENMYDILGVDKNICQKELKKRYKKLLLQHHPDKNKIGKNGVNSVVKIMEAYSILGDPIKRSSYDHNMAEAALYGDSPNKKICENVTNTDGENCFVHVCRCGDEVHVDTRLGDLFECPSCSLCFSVN